MTESVSQQRGPARPYHHGDLAAELMALACDHIAEHGIDKLSLRALAREAGVSPTAPYRHFPTKQCLLAALATQGFRELDSRVREATADRAGDPVAALHGIGHAYIDWARQEPVKYRLMFGSVIGDFSHYDQLHEAAEASYQTLYRTLRDGREQGLFVDWPMAMLGATCWASVHGIANLLIDKVDALRREPGAATAHTPRVLQSLDALAEAPETALALHIRGLLRHPDA
jgi:AcrR family transcriptional regulator